MAPVAKAVETLLERLNKVIEDPPKRMEMKFRTEPPEIIRPLPVGEGERTLSSSSCLNNFYSLRCDLK